MDMPTYANDWLNVMNKFNSEPFLGPPQKPIATECPNPNCRTVATTLVCNVCDTEKAIP